MTKTPKPNLNNILETLSVIKDNLPESLDGFMADKNLQDATLMRLQDIGEQLTRIRDNFPDFYQEYHIEPWNQLIGLRNIISHGYREVDFEIIWNIISKKLNEFEKDVTKLV